MTGVAKHNKHRVRGAARETAEQGHPAASKLWLSRVG